MGSRRRGGIRAAAVVAALWLHGCAQPVAVPTVAALPEQPSSAVAPPGDTAVAPPRPPSGERAPALVAGDRSVQGFVVDATLARVLAAQAKGDLATGIAALDGATGGTATPLDAWARSAMRAHLLNLAGRPSEAEREVERTRKLEIDLRGSDLVARTLRGDAATRLGRYAAARRDYETVLAALGPWRFPTSYGGPPTNLTDLAITTEARTRALLGLAFVHTMEGSHGPALAWSAEAERHMADLFAVADHPLYGPIMGKVPPDLYLARGINLAFLGSTLLATGQGERGEAFLAAGSGFFESAGYVHGSAYVSGLRALGLLRAGRDDEAAAEARQAAALAEKAGLLDMVWRVQVLAGKALLRAGRETEAEAALRAAQLAVDGITGLISDDADKRRFGIGKDDITRMLADIGFRKGDAEQLFMDLERGRARAFVDLLAPVRVATNVPAARGIRELDEQARAIALRLEIGGGDPAELAGVLRQRSDAVARLRASDPDLAGALAVAAPSLGTARAALGPTEMLVYVLPHAADERIRLILADRAGVRLTTLGVTGAELSARLVALAGAIDKDDVPGQEAVGRALSADFGVAAWTGRSAVRVVPSGVVHGIPWGITDVAVPVVVTPTGGWPLRQGRPRLEGAIVVGDPDFGGRLPDLPGARIEATTVAREVRGESLIGADATLERLRESTANGVGLLHLATHGKFFAADPLKSAIYLAGAQPLTARDLFERPLQASMIVLSACETGVGGLGPGDDLLGLPRSLYLGGTQAVLSSLWIVDDEGTLRFMETFHRAATKGNLGAAWLAARDALRGAGMPPWIYGAFVLGGSPSIQP